MDEGIPIINNRPPKQFVVEDGKLKGIWFESVTPVRQGRSLQVRSERRAGRVRRVRSRAHGHRPGQSLPVDRARRRRRIRSLGLPGARSGHAASEPKVFFGGDRPSVPRTSSGPRLTRTKRPSRSISSVREGSEGRPAAGAHESRLPEDGYHEWSYDSEHDPSKRHNVPHVPLDEHWRHQDRGRTGLRSASRLQEARRCLNCDVQTVFRRLCIECDACVDICPWTASRSRRMRGGRAALESAAPAANPRKTSTSPNARRHRPHHGQGRGRVSALRPVRRALSRRVGHAEIEHPHPAGEAVNVVESPRASRASPTTS